MRWTALILLGSIALSFALIGDPSFSLVGGATSERFTSAPRTPRWEQVWVGKRAVRICENGRCRVEYRDQYQWREVP